MSKMIKRVTAVAGVAAIGVASLAGCTTSSKKASSMFEVMGAVSDLKQYTYEMTTSMKSSDEDFEMVIYGKCDGNATTMSFEVESESEDISVKLEDFIITTQNMIYVNVDAIAAVLTESEEGSFDLGAYGVTADWISIELPEDYEQPEYDFDEIFDELDKTYADYIVEKDGKFILEVADDEVLKSIIDTTAEFIGDNSEQWSKDIVDAYDDLDVEKMMTDYISDMMKDINDSFDLGLSEEDINDYIDEAMDEMDTSDMEVNASDIKESLDELKEELLDAKEDATLDGSEIKITAYQDGKSYVTKAEVAAYEDDEKSAVEFSMVVTEDKSVEVEIPSKDVQTLVDVIGSVIDEMGLDEQIEDMLDDMSGMGDDDFSSMFGDDDFSSMFDDDDFSSMFDDDDFSSAFDDDEDDDEFDMYEDDLDDYTDDLWD